MLHKSHLEDGESQEFCVFKTPRHVLDTPDPVQIMTVPSSPTKLSPDLTAPSLQVEGDVGQTPGSRLVDGLVDPAEGVEKLVALVGPCQVDGCL